MERHQLEQLIATTGCVEQHGGYTVMVDPFWTRAQRMEFAQMVASSPVATLAEIDQGWLCIPTGGSSGVLRFARHDEKTLVAAAQGFRTHFALEQVNAVDVLPPWHVSGLMARIRCAVSGGRHLPWDWKRLEGGDRPEIAGDRWVLSLVPTQLQRLLAQADTVDWLRRLHVILVGGGPVWPTLAEAARSAGLPLALSYGMTETAAMVTAQLPADFAQGDRSSGRPLPHARIRIESDTPGQVGAVVVGGAAVMRGYWGEPAIGGEFVTPDLGRCEEPDLLHVVGRRDEVIITGGEKVNPAVVEAALRATGRFADVAVIAVPHSEWGEELVACHIGSNSPDQAELAQLSASLPLARHQKPKRYFSVEEATWPRNAQGKLNRALLRAMVVSRSAYVKPAG